MTEISTLTLEPAPTPETATCSRCHCISTLPQLFRKLWGNKYCPACAIKIEIRNTKILFAFIGLLTVSDLVIDGSTYGWLSWEAWSIPLSVLVVVLSLMLHELSHALAAQLVGGKVFGIQLGIGRQLLRRWFGDFYLGISQFPVSGLCFAAFPTNERLRLRYTVYVGSGLVFHALAIWGAVFLRQNIGYPHPILNWIITANSFLLLVNAFPYMATTAVGQSGSDGMMLWHLLTGKLNTQNLRHNYYRLATFFAHEQGKMDQASAYIHAGLAANPDDEMLENFRVFLLLRQENKIADAQSAWKSLLESDSFDSIPDLQKALVHNNYAWATLMDQPPKDGVQIAREHAEKAYQMAPWVASFKGTLAAVLIEQGEHQKGIELALAAAKEHEEASFSSDQNENLAENLATAALGYFRLGEQETAVRYLQQALAITTEGQAVKKAAAEIQ